MTCNYLFGGIIIDMKQSGWKVATGLVILAFLVTGAFLIANLKSHETKKYTVVASNFAAYDFARAVIGDAEQVKMLLKPGAEAHDFEPTPEDIKDIKNAELFIYNGGESEEWVERILEANDISSDKTFRMTDAVDLLEEEDGHEYDEHIWTNPKNAIVLVKKISERLPGTTKNADTYIEKIQKIDEKFREIVANSTKKELFFGDRFPFLYFVREYGLNYLAAFPGCAEQTEADAATIAGLIKQAKKLDTKVILKLELTNDKIARTIAEAVNAEVMEFSAAHNVSKADFENGTTYVDLMEKNTKVLAEALK